jgi:hypothetical protein
VSAVLRYKQLRKDADALRKMAGGGAYGGQTYWQNMRQCTGAAIADCAAEPPAGVSWGMSRDQMRAIWNVADLAPIWLAAAEELDRQAQGMIDELKKQAAEAADLAKELESKGGTP